MPGEEERKQNGEHYLCTHVLSKVKGDLRWCLVGVTFGALFPSLRDGVSLRFSLTTPDTAWSFVCGVPLPVEVG